LPILPWALSQYKTTTGRGFLLPQIIVFYYVKEKDALFVIGAFSNFVVAIPLTLNPIAGETIL